VRHPGLQGGSALGDASTPGTPTGSMAASTPGGTHSRVAVARGAWGAEMGTVAAIAVAVARRRVATPTGRTVNPPRSASARGRRGGRQGTRVGGWNRPPRDGAPLTAPVDGVVLRQRCCTRGCGRWCSEAGWSVVCRFCGVPLRRVSACGARVWVSSSDCPVLTAGRVNPDWVVSCIGGNYLHRRYLAARDRAN